MKCQTHPNIFLIDICVLFCGGANDRLSMKQTTLKKRNNNNSFNNGPRGQELQGSLQKQSIANFNRLVASQIFVYECV